MATIRRASDEMHLIYRNGDIIGELYSRDDEPFEVYIFAEHKSHYFATFKKALKYIGGL